MGGDDKENELAQSVEFSDEAEEWGASSEILNQPPTAAQKKDDEAEHSDLELSEDEWGMDTGKLEEESKEQKIEQDKGGGILNDLFSQFMVKEPEQLSAPQRP